MGPLGELLLVGDALTPGGESADAGRIRIRTWFGYWVRGAGGGLPGRTDPAVPAARLGQR